MTYLKFTILALLLLALNTNSIYAQEGNTSKTVIELSPEKINAFVGYFRNPDNKEMVVQFIPGDNHTLKALLMWNNKSVKLYPSSETEFFSKEGESVNLQFIKGGDGSISQLIINGDNNHKWERAKDYKPVVHTEMTHTPAQLKAFEGVYTYHNENTSFVEFKEKDNKLILKELWDAQETPFVPETELDFFNPQQPMTTVTFTKDSTGAISKMLAFKRDTWVKVPTPQVTVDQLRGFTGKFRGKDDPDNVILISIKGNGLVVKQMWDKKEILISPKSAVYFYNNEESFPVLFMKEKDGSVYRVRVLDGIEFERMKD